MKGYQQHEAFVADVRMYWQMFFFAFLLGFLLQLATFGYLAHRSFAENFTIPLAGGRTFAVPFKAVLKCFYPKFVFMGRENKLEVMPEVAPFFHHEGLTAPAVPQSAYKAIMDKYFGERLDDFTEDLKRLLGWSFCAYLLSAGYCFFFLKKSSGLNKSKYLRGAVKVPLARLRQSLATAAKNEAGPPDSHLHVCGLPFPRDLEAKHILIMGATGTGKSVLFNQLIGQVRHRKKRLDPNEKMIIYDVKGEFLSKHYRAGDLIFYPFDERSLRWSFFNEIRCEPDYDIISEIIFRPPKDTKADPFWNNAARAVFVAGLHCLAQANSRTNRHIWEFFCRAAADIIEDIKQLPLIHRQALKHIEGESEAAEGVLSTLAEKISFFQHLVNMDGDFSFQEFIRRPDSRNLFLMNVSRYAQIWQPLITLACDVMIRETLSLPDDAKRRIWFCIDEIGSLHQISVLFDLLTMGRSKGGCMIAASQDLGKIEDVYGRPNKITFYNNFNTGFFLRINDPDTADFLSRSIGEREVIKIMEGRQLSPKDAGDRKSFTEQDKIEKLLLPAEFMRQPDLRAIVKFSAYGISEVDVPQTFYPEKAPAFLDLFRSSRNL